MNIGADDYLTKPFDENELLEAIAARLEKHDALRKEFSKDIESVNLFFDDTKVQDDLKSLSENRDAEVFNLKDFVFMEGDAAHTLYYIQKGAVKTYKTVESGKSLVTGLFGVGQFVGQLSLLTGQGKYRDTATVMEEAELIKIPKTEFTELLFGDKHIANKFITMLSNDMLNLQEQLISMAFDTVRQRLAKVLLNLSNSEILNNTINKGIVIAREDLAHLIGTATETAIRMLTKFKDENVITIGTQKEIIIKDIKRLEYMAAFE